jgi:ankyrin repeat protein
VPDPLFEFMREATVPLDAAHASGTLARAEAILAEHPDVSRASIHAAAILGDDATVRDFIARDVTLATQQGGPHGWDALTHLCFSRYLRLDRTRSAGFVRAATALLDAGASAQTGWWEQNHRPDPEWESALYGAAGIAHDAALTRLLVERGADPNDVETVYHSPETYDNSALRVLVETGRITAENLSLMLVRKHDWHDLEGARWLLEHGADPGTPWASGRTPFDHAIARDNSPEMIGLLLDHGADPTRVSGDLTGVARAARAGRRDLLELFRARGFDITLTGVDALVAACALDDGDAIATLAAGDPALVAEVATMGPYLLATFAGTDNGPGLERLLDLGIAVDARVAFGDGYWGVAPGSTALHVAAWRAAHRSVRVLLARGARPSERDGHGRTPLQLALRACVDSYWSQRRTPASIDALLQAGASASEVVMPTGYPEADALLTAAG